jgi:3-oxoacyl-[acyl-carrier-protein] synthase II
MRRVVVTGIGAVTPVGNDAAATWRALLAGRSGIDYITTFPADTFAVRIAGSVKDFDLAARLPDPHYRRLLKRGGGFAVAAMCEALHDAHVDSGTYQPYERGIALGSLCPRPVAERSLWRALATQDPEKLAEVEIPPPLEVLALGRNMALTIMGLLSGCQGPMMMVDNACSSAANAIGDAFHAIQYGDVELMIAGGYGDYAWMDVAGFSLLGVLADGNGDDPRKAFRPFDRARAGFVLGEGAVILILEERDAALARGARIYAELVGFASSMNAYRITDSPLSGGGAVMAMQRALDESGVGRTGIDYVAAHGTATEDNDRSETAALKQVFGDHAYRLAISAPKAMTGHLLGAAAALNLVVAILAMRDGIVPPTINHEHSDAGLDLDYVPNIARRMSVGAALVNAYGFAGVNTSLIVCRPDFFDDRPNGAAGPSRRALGPEHPA